ncbi:MAG: ABC transporter permease subunit, partial [Chloroflexi bacterium]|nr:ABC transporter permease subunit [Chloroflexota bacterium]
MRLDDLLRNFFDVQHMYTLLPELLHGLRVTVEIAALSLAGGLLLGLLLALVRAGLRTRGCPAWLRWSEVLIVIYVDVARALPPLVTLVVVYFALPYLGVFVLVLGAFAEEGFRAGIEALDRGQMEAARALGLTFLQGMMHVVAPQAVKIAIPELTGRMVSITKDVSLASVIGVSDLLRVAKLDIARSGNYSSLIAAAILFTL